MNLRFQNIFRNNMAQMYTLEGVVAAILMIFLIAFVVKASPLTPLTSSTSHQQVEAQIETRGNDLLTVLDHIDSGETYSPLKKGLIEWSGVGFEGQYPVYPTSVIYVNSIFTRVLLGDGTAYNLEVAYLNEDDEWETRPMFWNGLPSDNSVLVTRKMVIHDEDETYLIDNNFNNSWIVTDVLPDISNNSGFYNILELKLTLWRM